jgi:hypothetical protein
MIVNEINTLLLDLTNYHRPKETVLYYAVSQRLDKSLKSYTEELYDSFKYLQNRKPDKLMRKLNK